MTAGLLHDGGLLFEFRHHLCVLLAQENMSGATLSPFQQAAQQVGIIT